LELGLEVLGDFPKVGHTILMTSNMEQELSYKLEDHYVIIIELSFLIFMIGHQFLERLFQQALINRLEHQI
jgi:hypothetical protein